jgi:tetratricopeptide (TPR) repeat protein
MIRTLPRPASRRIGLARASGLLLLGAVLAGCQNVPRLPFMPGSAALTSARNAATAQPEDPEALARLADAAERAGTPSEAAAALDRLIELQSPTAPRLMRLGSARLRNGDYQAAANAFAAARQLAPSDAVAASGHGIALDLLGDGPGALEAHGRAVALNPNDLTLRGNQALSLIIARRAGEAVQLLSPVERDRASPRRVRHTLALALAAGGDQNRLVRLLRIEAGAGDAERQASEFRAYAEALAGMSHADAAAAMFRAGLPGGR